MDLTSWHLVFVRSEDELSEDTMELPHCSSLPKVKGSLTWQTIMHSGAVTSMRNVQRTLIVDASILGAMLMIIYNSQTEFSDNNIPSSHHSLTADSATVMLLVFCDKFMDLATVSALLLRANLYVGSFGRVGHNSISKPHRNFPTTVRTPSDSFL